MAVDTIEKALFARLTGHAGTAALIGTRMYPGALPQGTEKPAVYYEMGAETRLSTNDSDSAYREVEIDVTAVADSYSSCAAVKKQIEAALARWAQSSPVQVLETLIEADGPMPVEETEEWIAVITADIQYFAQ